MWKSILRKVILIYVVSIDQPYGKVIRYHMEKSRERLENLPGYLE